MKKISCLFIAAVMILSLFAGCSSEPESVPEATTEDTTIQEEVPVEEMLPHETTPVDPVPAEPDDSVVSDSIKVNMGQEYTIDLDGDGMAETILCSYTLDKNGMQQLSVKINGVECYTYDTRYWDAIQDYYYIVDLYTNDQYMELAILDAGPSSDPITVFFYYHDAILEECGTVAGFVGSDQVTISGDSTITAIKRLQVLQTWWGWTTWVVNENHLLEELPQDLYVPTSGSNVNISLIQDLSVFSQMDSSSERVTLSAETELVITGTDNKNWVCVEAGVTPYWIYLPEGWEIDTGSGTVWPDEVISGLIWAD